MKIRFEAIEMKWRSAAMSEPDDARDVLVYMERAMWNDEKKRMEKMKQMQVAHCEGGTWFWEGRTVKKKYIIKWTEIPVGWNG